MMTPRRTATAFCEGDEVVLAEGSYQGTLGVFLRLREDVNWADITERNGRIRSRPVAWLAHANGAIHSANSRLSSRRFGQITQQMEDNAS